MSMNEISLSAVAGTGRFRPDRRRVLDIPREFLEMLPVAIYACDVQGRLLWFNRRAVDLWGREPRVGDGSERFCGAHKLFFNGRQIRHDETPMAEVLRTGIAVPDAEVAIERPDGSRSWVQVHISPILDNDGSVAGAINCFHEITELRHATDRLLRKPQELEDFFENGAVALHLVGCDGTILRANRAELELLGYVAEEYIGRPIAAFHADHKVCDEILRRLRQGESLDKFPARLRAKDGSIRHVLITSNGQFKDGRLVNTRCFTIDVTESKLAESKLQESDRRFRQLLDALPAAVYTTDAEGRITYYNEAAVELSGRRPELGSDRWCVTWRLYRPDGTPLPHDECPMAMALKEGRAIRHVEAIAERPDGTRIPFIPFPSPMYDDSGNVVGAVNMLVDVSERKQAETQQRVLLDELNHRVKNNLQMLYSLLWGAQREAGSAEAREVLVDASQRVAAMAAAQRVLYDTHGLGEFEAKDFLEAVCDAARQTLSNKVELIFETASGRLSNDVAMPLALILSELLTNAAKHGVNGDGENMVRVGLTHDCASSLLYVEDDGPGFELGDVRKRSSGLGLVVGLARQIGGTFAVERTPGARCCVQFARQRSA